MHWQLQCAVKIEGLNRVEPLLDGERVLSLGMHIYMELNSPRLL